MTATVEITVYQVPKVCACGSEWLGPSFEPADQHGRSTLGRCQECVSAWRRDLNRVLANKPGVVTLAPPTADRDQPHESPRRMRLA